MTAEKAFLIFLLGPPLIIGTFFLLYFWMTPLKRAIHRIHHMLFNTYDPNASVLFAAFGHHNDIREMSVKVMKGREFAAYGVTNEGFLFGASHRWNGVLYQVGLHAVEPLHIICFSTHAKHTKRPWYGKLGQSGYQRVQLESTFPDYFHVYVHGGAVVPLLEVFTPKTMSYFMDYCQNFDFEILHNNIYAYQEAHLDTNDTSSTAEDLFTLAGIVEKEVALLGSKHAHVDHSKNLHK